MGGNCTSFKRTVEKNLSDFRQFLWNGETSELMGRTAGSWIQIFFFYLIFYSLLAAFWALLLFARVQLLPEESKGPLRTDYLTHRGPGMSVVPTYDDFERKIKFNKDKPKTYKSYVEGIDQFFDEYTTIDGKNESWLFSGCAHGQEGSCSASNGYFEAANLQVIKSVQQGNETVNKTSYHKLYNLMNLGECENDYGYESGEPCLYFTVNKVYDWVPDELSEDRKEKSSEIADKETSENFVPFSCHGFKKGDKDKIESVSIYPEMGFHRDYFPWTAGEYFRPPIVAAKIKIKPEAVNKRIRLECKIYADNIHGDSREKPNIGRIEVSLTISEQKNKSNDEGNDVNATEGGDNGGENDEVDNGSDSAAAANSTVNVK